MPDHQNCLLLNGPDAVDSVDLVERLALPGLVDVGDRVLFSIIVSFLVREQETLLRGDP